MNKNERAALPPPPDCMSCASLQAWKSRGAMRYECLRDLPMHPGCQRHKPKARPA